MVKPTLHNYNVTRGGMNVKKLMLTKSIGTTCNDPAVVIEAIGLAVLTPAVAEVNNDAASETESFISSSAFT